MDAKGRVSVPVEFRRELPGKDTEKLLTIMVGPGKRLLAFPDDEFMRTYRPDDLMQSDLNSKEESDRDLLLLTDASKRQIDAQGRITIPQRLLEHAGIKKSALFFGRLRFIEIWDPEEFRKNLEQARQRKTLDQALTQKSVKN
ncbi:hypothetical protein IT157_06015 [bacterium]|nr:hypothetical protein [bacterium]